MAKDLLIEIGLEEIPARFVREAARQLSRKVEEWLRENRIKYDSSRMFATPRRLAVHVKEVAEVQEDIREEVKGPAKRIAVDYEGNWTKAGLGFARGQGLETANLFFQDVGGTQYVFALKESEGIATSTLLEQNIASVITSMSFPKNMRWGMQELKFVRPIRWLVALFGTEVIPFEIAGVRTGRNTIGHRFLGKEAELSQPLDYVPVLKREYVIADIDERKDEILKQIRSLAERNGWHIDINPDLLEEVLFLVEYPTVLHGSFDVDFLNIPAEVLITSMREHQRYFPVLDRHGRLLPHFVTVRNGNDVSIEQVAKGNEKVLRARLSDAAFFYREDQKATIAQCLHKLQSIVFHEELGTLSDKVERITNIAGKIVRLAGLGEVIADDVQRTARICKFDLVTQMVNEFPELQGRMGQDYALKLGETKTVADAVFEHYLPRFSGDALPRSAAGAIVSLADKMDTICGSFAIGIIPTGSQDPYALRRQASGIVQILLAQEWPLVLSALFETALDSQQKAGNLKRGRDEIMNDLRQFFALRVKNALDDQNIRYDTIDAVMNADAGFDDIVSTMKRAQELQKRLPEPDFKHTVEAFNRVGNLAAKAVRKQTDPALFQEEEEKALFFIWQGVHEIFSGKHKQKETEQVLQQLCLLQEPITRYFAKVMVMAEDPVVRENRLGLLALVHADISTFADFQKLVIG